MSNCACNNCISTKRPPREAMTLLQGDADRRIYAALVGHVLIVDAYDSDGAGGWDRDPEYGVALDRDGVLELRKLLGQDLEEPMEPKIEGGSLRA